MIFGSVCSGIGAAELAWGSLGWRCAFSSEIAQFPRAVLEQRFGAGTANGPKLFGDFTTIKANDHEPIDVLVGGTPCQSFSVAGLRGGLDDDRGNLALEFLRLASRARPRWVVWENVPGVLSSGKGRDFGAFVGGMVELGYGLAWRSLDAQFFGLAQRRKRVFVVGCLGGWRAPVEVLLEPEGMRGDSPPGRGAREGAACGAGRSASGGRGAAGAAFVPDVSLCLNAGGMGRQDAESETLIAGTLAGGARASGGYSTDDIPLVTHSLRGEGFDASEDGTGRGVPLVPVAGTLCANSFLGGMGGRQDAPGNGHVVGYRVSPNCGVWSTGDRIDALTTGTDPTSHVVAFDTTQITSRANRSNPAAGDPCHPLAAAAHPPAIAFSPQGSGKQTTLGFDPSADTAGALTVGRLQALAGGSAVRRLTPRECERLQGFPDDHTAIVYRGKPAADGPRYKALGNSMAVPVMAWIGRRIEAVDKLARRARP